MGNFTVFSPVFAGRQRILWSGMSLARVESQQYVLCRGCMLSAFGEAEYCLPPTKMAPTEHRRGADYHNGRAGRRPVGKSAIPCMGLPPSAAEFLWTDLPALYPIVGVDQPGGYVALCPAGSGDQLFSWITQRSEMMVLEIKKPVGVKCQRPSKVLVA